VNEHQNLVPQPVLHQPRADPAELFLINIVFNVAGQPEVGEEGTGALWMACGQPLVCG